MADAADTPVHLTLNVNDLTFEELEELEELVDLPFTEFFSGKRSAKVMRGLAFIELRRADPTYTWEQAGALKVGMGNAPAEPKAGKRLDPPAASA